MANYLYNDTVLPELPSAVSSRTLYIWQSSVTGLCFLRWCVSGVTLYWNPSIPMMTTCRSKTGWAYGHYKALDGVWVEQSTGICQVDSGTQNYHLPTGAKLVWTNTNVLTVDGSAVFMAPSDPVLALETDLAPLSMLQGWFMGRKAAQMRQP